MNIEDLISPTFYLRRRLFKILTDGNPAYANARMGLARAVRSVADKIEPTPEPPAPRVIRPRPGPQTEFLASTADVAFLVGGPWTGKTTALLIDWMRHVNTPDARGLIVCQRRTDITIGGGLWDEAKRLYEGTGATFMGGPKMTATWPSGASLSFRHLDGEWPDRMRFHGLVYGWIGVHDAHQISGRAFAMLATCLRSQGDCPAPRMRATADSWEDWMDKFALRANGSPTGVQLIRTTEADVIPPDGMTREQAIDRLRMGNPRLWVAS